MCTAVELVVLFGWPCGPTALFHAVQTTVCTPSPSTVMPRAAYGCGVLVPTLQFIPPTPEGPALAVANTVTAWLAQMVRLASFDVLSATSTGSLSTWSVSESAVLSPAALIALIASGRDRTGQVIPSVDARAATRRPRWVRTLLPHRGIRNCRRSRQLMAGQSMRRCCTRRTGPRLRAVAATGRRGVPNPFPATGLEPEVAGSLRGQDRALALARSQPDGGEIDPARAGARGRSAVHLIPPVPTGESGVGHVGRPVRPCGATAIEVGVPGPSGTAVEDAPRRGCARDRDARRRHDLGVHVLPGRGGPSRSPSSSNAPLVAVEREVRRWSIAYETERIPTGRNCTRCAGVAVSVSAPAAKALARNVTPSASGRCGDRRGNRGCSPECGHCPSATYLPTGTRPGRRTCGQLP